MNTSGSRKLLVVGFILYREFTAKYLPYFLPGLTAQADCGCELKILAVDNSEEEDNENAEYIKKNYPDIELKWAGANIGFARAYNRMIRRAKESGAAYFLTLNPDMVLEADAIKSLTALLEGDDRLGAVSPKVRRWDFAGNRTDYLDTCGIVLKPGLRFIDLGQGEADRGQYDNAAILGPSGAAGLYRLAALEKIKEGDDYFDERMFMYKEDCDLAYRLQAAGYISKCAGNAVVYHDRTAAGQGAGSLAAALNRKRKSRRVKEWSFLNQHIIFIKHWRTLNFLNKLAVIWYAFRMFVYVLLFERYLLKQYGGLLKLR